MLDGYTRQLVEVGGTVGTIFAEGIARDTDGEPGEGGTS
jgi:hypothetical protein